MNEDPRGSRAGTADGPSSDPSSVAPPPLPAFLSHESPPLPSIQVSDVNIQDGAFNHISSDIDGSNEGEGPQSVFAPNFASGIDGNVHMNSPVASHSGSRSRGSRRSRRSSPSPNPSFIPSTDGLERNARASPSPPEETGDMHETLQNSPPSSSPPQSSPAPPRSSPTPPRATPRPTSFSGIKINNGAFNHVNSPCKVTNKGSGTQTVHGPNIATNVGGNVSMNSRNVTTIITSNSNNDYSTHRHHYSRSGEFEFTL